MVDSGRLPSIKPATLLENEKKALELNGTYAHPKDDKIERGSPIRQVLAAIVAQLGTINTGMVFGFAAIANAQLKDSNDFIITTESQRTWIGTPF